MVATLSLLGLYRYRRDILDDFKLPEGIDRDDFIEMLLFDTAELELLTPNPDIMKQLLGRWSNVRVNAWSKMLDTETVEYNPIHNYDRQEEWVDDGAGSVKNSGSNITDLSVAGFNEADMADRERTVQTVGTGTDTTSQSRHTARIYGNIGVTTTQQMLESEREFRKYSTVYEIIGEFKEKFCLLVY